MVRMATIFLGSTGASMFNATVILVGILERLWSVLSKSPRPNDPRSEAFFLERDAEGEDQHSASSCNQSQLSTAVLVHFER